MIIALRPEAAFAWKMRSDCLQNPIERNTLQWEYTGSDFEVDMAGMAEDPTARE